MHRSRLTGICRFDLHRSLRRRFPMSCRCASCGRLHTRSEVLAMVAHLGLEVVDPTQQRIADEEERVRARLRSAGIPIDLSDTLSERDAARFFNRSPRTLREWQANGEITNVHIGRTPRYRVQDLVAYLVKQAA